MFPWLTTAPMDALRISVRVESLPTEAFDGDACASHVRLGFESKSVVVTGALRMADEAYLQAPRAQLQVWLDAYVEIFR